MASIYIHIPFCKQACHYCNFHFSTKKEGIPTLVNAILKEIQLQKNYLAGEAIETIYFGGGTPSILSNTQLQSILNAIHINHTITNDVEVTLEMNPDDALLESMTSWLAMGINRLSIGIQSFDAQILQWMHRAHNATQAKQCITLAQQAGFSNISADLIYGNKNQTLQDWEIDIDTLLSYNIPHISSYALTIEPNTVLGKKIALQKEVNVNDALQSDMFNVLVQKLTSAGYEHYEISNFAKPNKYSKHNSSYWQQKKYIGIGPSAHSYNGISRQWNVSNNDLYIENVNNEGTYFEIELLTEKDNFNEYVMTSLRTSNGISKHYIEKKFPNYVTHLQKQINKYVLLAKVEESLTHYKLTSTGKFFADGIAANCFL